MNTILTLFSLGLLLSCASIQPDKNYSKIEYEAGACFGFCPIYKITITSDRSAIFEAQRFNFSQDTTSEEKEGTFTGEIDSNKYNQLTEILDLLQPKNLKDYYGNQQITDLPTSYLTITYQDRTVKKIQDYGKHGTPDLEKLYQFFEALKTNQNWTKIE